MSFIYPIVILHLTF